MTTENENIFTSINWDEIYADHDAVYKARASIGSPDRTFVGWNTGVSVKSHYTRGDYKYFRSNSFNTDSRSNMLRVCQEAYKRVSVIQNVINLMSDFGCKGIRFRHKDKKIEKLAQTWAEKVNVPERSERFLNTFFRLGVVIVYESLGRIDNTKIDSKYVPLKYTFLNPALVRIKDEDKNVVPENPVYEIVMYASESDRALQKKASAVPEILQDKLSKPLNSERLSVYNYRKDDWEFWGTPITYSILDQLEMLEKLQLADISALDGAISQVRLWTVGKITDNPQTTFMPTKPMLEKIRNVLANGLGGGTMDVVWGPELDFKESSTNVHQFLGEAKYKPVLDAIYDGMGVPSSLRSSNKETSNANPISLKTLIERLNYGRVALLDFWRKQLKKLFKAAGLDVNDLPVIEFDYMILTDEAAEKKLLIDLMDRDVVDAGSVLERFNFDPEIVAKKLKQENDKRGGDVPEKAGPFHNPHVKDDMKKTLLANQSAAPHEVGLDVKVPEEEQKKRFTMPPQKKTPAAGGVGTKTKGVGGRPKNKVETNKRNKKGTGPSRAKAGLQVTVWASSAQKQISDIFTPIALSVYNKKNVRSLSVKETEALEIAKAKILLAMKPFSEITPETVEVALNTEINSEFLNALAYLQDLTSKDFGRELTTEEKRNIISVFYAGVYNGEDSSDV